MPELLRAWGEALRERSDSAQVAVLIAFGFFAVLLAIFTLGALVQGFIRGFRLIRQGLQRRAPRTPEPR